MKNDRIKTVAVIPAYNEENSIGKVILRAKRYVDEVVVCDDGSTDMTFMICKALGARVVRHEENRGKGETLRTLCREAMKLDPEIIVAIDGDGQHNPDEIPMLVKPIEAGISDIVVGSRYVDGGKMDAPFFRRFGMQVINFVYRRAGLQIRDPMSGFRAYSQKAFEFLMQRECDEKGYGTDGEQLVLAAKNGLRLKEVPIRVKYKNLTKTSKRSPLIQGGAALSTFFRLVVEKQPLKCLGLPGIGLTFIGAMLGLYLLSMFNTSRYFSIPLAILSVGNLIVGLLLTIAAIILQGLKRINERLKKINDQRL